ncbi:MULTISPECIES: glycine betaine/L-proline ABC transporter permease ProW [Rahnella]|uniref:glycine betaine/L-proline ABC transporter permease ProW n=1 Tax=Rahnella TaxID=34037 RepID=UPI000EFC12CE|nr:MULTISPECIES: glycine betaine/L-proline ABC transporter permease ProW [Rahnella]MBU9830666.1 glycine betaine/L-proline ABC transporter permease ProW [Rahnella rivi]THD56077.1 proline/glycine betaine ABC transporter permease ProW [Enterobacteriaceae bacterium ML5]
MSTSHITNSVTQHAQAAQAQALDPSIDPWSADNASGGVAPQADAATSAAPADAGSSDPWGGGSDAATSAPDTTHHAAAQANDWLSVAPEQHQHFSILDPFHSTLIPLDHWVTEGIDWLVTNFRPVFQGIRVPVDFVLSGFQHGLETLPAPIAILVFALIAWQMAGLGMGAATLVSLVLIGAIGAWSQAMVTLALVLTSLFFCILIGLPLGIWLARSQRAAKIIRPLLDAMQTTPAFVYLVPIVMLFGIGNVPGVVVTIIFALPPVVRLTILGINQVPEDLIEAAKSFGSSPRQLLFKVQLPLAMPTIMAGINQTLMLALSMVVIASMIAVGGLGQMVLRGIGRLDMGLASVGGAGIVILAIILDRLTQSMGRDSRSKGGHRWFTRGPVGLVMKPFAKKA